MVTISTQSPWRGDAAIAVTVITWASAFPAIGAALVGYSPGALGLLRLAVAATVLGAMAAWWRIPRPRGSDIGRLLVVGLLGQTLYMFLLMTGQQRVAAGTAALLITTAPVLSVVVARLALGETVGRRWIGLLVALAGAALVAVTRDFSGGAELLAVAAVMAAALCQGAYHVLVKPLAERLGPLAATAWSVIAGAALSLPALPWLIDELPRAPLAATLPALYLGVVPSALGFLAWSRAVAATSVARSTVALYLVPAVALVLSWMWLGEVPDPLALLGGAMAVVGVVLVRRVKPLAGPRARPGDDVEVALDVDVVRQPATAGSRAPATRWGHDRRARPHRRSRGPECS